MRFRYLRDPLFRICVAAYFLNRLVLKPLLPDSFCHTHLNDLLCIPFWLPIMLWVMRQLRLRPDDAPPQAHEILVPLLLWSVVFELLLPATPMFRDLSFADPWDVVAYVCGALVAAIWWRAWYSRGRALPTTD